MQLEDMKGAIKILSDMMGFRDRMLAIGIWPSFAYAMNLLGYEGTHAPDYEPDLSETGKEQVRSGLAELGEL